MAVLDHPNAPAPRELHKSQDNATQSNYHEIATQHVDLVWSVDWTTRLISGSATHTMTVLKDGTTHAIFDASYLDITSIHLVGEHDKSTGRLEYDLFPRHKVMGSALKVVLPHQMDQGQQVKIKIDYSTTKHCTALGWLNPEQTHSKKYGFLYSQCQAIHCRSLVPIQDTPALKITYTAAVTSPLPILMSALRLSPPSEEIIEIDVAKTITYTFKQPVPIPSYLIAIASGELQFASLTQRCGVWAAPGMIQQAEWEFKADAEKFVCATRVAETLTSPYRWGRFDVLVLPASFPYGGMENANMTFLTPALVVGDRSQVDVIAHELSHSWFGNGISCNSWDSFWLNEGFTTCCERMIAGEMRGAAARDFEFIVGMQGLKASLKQQAKTPRFQRLHIPYAEGEDPDDGFSSVPYDKGANFLYLIERTVGGVEVFKPYLIAYVKRFDGLSISTQDWLDHFWDYWNQYPKISAKLRSEIDFDAWLNGEGLNLPNKIEYDTSIADGAYALAAKWDQARDKTEQEVNKLFNKDDVGDWSSPAFGMFLDTLTTRYDAFDPKIVRAVDRAYGVNSSTNPEVLLRWYLFTLGSGCYEKDAAVWIRDQGRMKYVRPLYVALNKVDSKLAKETFDEYGKAFLHPIARAMVAKDLGISEE
ncbi:BQ2448_1332 [Microbotryum intermedium]|uniref:BQ2448_1332 protein n=1 Tax=Microbotryum intermedium TaxID=269621 RepID=A0A238FFL8_9BASI|nr:BQ2448_1332 [Microbotryum intermedium]